MKTATYPEVGQVFELMLTEDQLDGIDMVKNFGYNPDGWRYTGQQPTPETGKFKLVQVGFCNNLQEVAQKLKEHGDIPAGQWLQAFNAVYPKPDGNGPIGVADNSWVDPDGSLGFPCMRSDGGAVFYWADFGLGEVWRWLVRCK